MIVAQIVADPITVGLVIGLPATVLGYLGYRRSVKLDRVAASSAALTLRSDEVKQVIDGLNTIVGNLQGDNRDLRGIVDGLRQEVRELQAEVAALKGR